MMFNLLHLHSAAAANAKARFIYAGIVVDVCCTVRCVYACLYQIVSARLDKGIKIQT